MNSNQPSGTQRNFHQYHQRALQTTARFAGIPIEQVCNRLIERHNGQQSQPRLSDAA